MLKHHKTFRLTVAICVLGILTISGLSYYIGSRTLHKNLERELENAVFAIQEISNDDNAAARVLTGSTNAPAYLVYKEKLTRFLSQRSEISTVGIALYDNNGGKLFLVAGTNSPAHDLPEHLRSALLSHPAAEQKEPISYPDGDGAALISHLHLPDGTKVHAAAAVARIEAGSTLLYYAGQLSASLKSKQYALLLLEASKALFYIAAIMLSIVFYASATKEKLRELNACNRELEEELQHLREKEKKLREIIRDNDRFNALTLRREERIILLKSEVNQLLAQMQREKRYNVDKTD